MATKKSYAQLQTELDDILTQLQSGELAIDEALALHKAGEKLVTQLEAYLASAKNEVEQLKK
jgi:exodeoxyribonuclease VII small subunit